MASPQWANVPAGTFGRLLERAMEGWAALAGAVVGATAVWVQINQNASLRQRIRREDIEQITRLEGSVAQTLSAILDIEHRLRQVESAIARVEGSLNRQGPGPGRTR
jgi:hypothetical protein